MTRTEEIMQLALSATDDRKRDALKVLKGEVALADSASLRQGSGQAGPLLMGIGAGAKYLGVSRATLWRACVAGRIEKVELYPGSYRVRREDLERLAAGGRRE
jgi:hypothetical protein